MDTYELATIDGPYVICSYATYLMRCLEEQVCLLVSKVCRWTLCRRADSLRFQMDPTTFPPLCLWPVLWVCQAVPASGLTLRDQICGKYLYKALWVSTVDCCTDFYPSFDLLLRRLRRLLCA